MEDLALEPSFLVKHVIDDIGHDGPRYVVMVTKIVNFIRYVLILLYISFRG